MSEKDAPEPAEKPPDLLQDAFRSELHRHGYGFQYALVRHIETSGTRWRVEAVEFPVEFRGRPLHIDFILGMVDGLPLRIVAECKRANPALVDWCFVRAPGFPQAELVSIEYVQSNSETGRSYALLDRRNAWTSDRVYNLAFPIKGSKKGDKAGDNKTALDSAVEQALRGANGLMELLARDTNLLVRQTATVNAWCGVVPVVFTTAKLWVSDLDLSASDLSTGRVEPLSLTETPWLWLKLNISPALKHSLVYAPTPNEQRRESLRDYLLRDYSRSVAIVSVDGIISFLSNPHFSL
jgi:hypothetical protein